MFTSLPYKALTIWSLPVSPLECHNDRLQTLCSSYYSFVYLIPTLCKYIHIHIFSPSVSFQKLLFILSVMGLPLTYPLMFSSQSIFLLEDLLLSARQLNVPFQCPHYPTVHIINYLTNQDTWKEKLIIIMPKQQEETRISVYHLYISNIDHAYNSVHVVWTFTTPKRPKTSREQASSIAVFQRN